MEFEFDPNKSQTNQQKHGIDFVEAQILWDDSNYLEIPASEINEPRYLIIGKIKNSIWAAVVTYRGDKVRIISVRRARKEEVTLYESE
ncbi:MAG: BrnT family toxin [Gammaproteobacteria bacterium]|nr:BrnT family toxin [Gammaproteobacteria bacterium]